MKLCDCHFAPLLATAIALAALGGCGKGNDPSPAALSAVQREAARLRSEASRSGDTISNGIDAAITTAVNAELARDGKLEPTRIDVGVARGRVALRGTAPDAESVQRARDRAGDQGCDRCRQLLDRHQVVIVAPVRRRAASRRS